MNRVESIEVLQAKAREESIRAHGGGFHEHAALIFTFESETRKPVIIEVDNSADFNELEITMEELLLVAQYLSQAFGPLVHMDIAGVCLWHSHNRSVEPSERDIAMFPLQLCDMGRVYHAPTGTTTAYDSSGVCFETSKDSTSSIAPSES